MTELKIVERELYIPADRLANGPMSADKLSGPTETDPSSLYRLMRTLASIGILTEDAEHRCVHRPGLRS